MVQQDTEPDVKVKFFSWKYLWLTLTAFFLWQYSARDWAIAKVGAFTFSLKLLFGEKLWDWIAVYVPWFTHGVETSWFVLKSLALATFQVITSTY